MSLSFPRNGTQCLLDRIEQGLEASTNDSIECSQVKMTIDQTQQMFYFQMNTDLHKAYDKAMDTFLTAHNKSKEQFSSGIQIVEQFYGTEEFNFDKPTTSGSVRMNRMFSIRTELVFFQYVVFVYFIAFLITFFSIADQKDSGHFERALANGATKLEILLVNFIILSLLVSIPVAILLAVERYLFEFINQGSSITMFLMLWITSLSGIGGGIMIVSIVARKMDGMILMFIINMVNYFACGHLWPLQSIQNVWVKRMIQCLPLALTVDSAHSVMNRGIGLSEPQVWMGLVPPSIGIVLCLTLSCLLFSVNKNA